MKAKRTNTRKRAIKSKPLKLGQVFNSKGFFFYKYLSDWYATSKKSKKAKHRECMLVVTKAHFAPVHVEDSRPQQGYYVECRIMKKNKYHHKGKLIKFFQTGPTASITHKIKIQDTLTQYFR